MKHIKLFEEFVNESTTDGSIEALIQVAKISMNMGVFNDELLKNVQSNLTLGVQGALKGQTLKLPIDKRSEFNGYVDSLMKPLEAAKTMEQFFNAMMKVAIIKDSIFARLSIDEQLNESKVLDLLKKAKNATVTWWNEHGLDILIFIGELLAQIIVEILFGILRGLLKSDKLDAPKIKFGGGKFGGGGAGGSW